MKTGNGNLKFWDHLKKGKQTQWEAKRQNGTKTHKKTTKKTQKKENKKNYYGIKFGVI